MAVARACPRLIHGIDAFVYNLRVVFILLLRQYKIVWFRTAYTRKNNKNNFVNNILNVRLRVTELNNPSFITQIFYEQIPSYLKAHSPTAKRRRAVIRPISTNIDRLQKHVK